MAMSWELDPDWYTVGADEEIVIDDYRWPWLENKADILSGEAGCWPILVAHLCTLFGTNGRKRLVMMVMNWSLTVISSSDGCSIYQMIQLLNWHQ